MKYVVLRSSADAMDDAVVQVHEFLVDPRIGQHGGFVLDKIETEHPQYRDLIATSPTYDRWLPRRVRETRQVQDGIGQMHTIYVCEAEESDAYRIVQSKTGWTYYAANDSMLAALTHVSEDKSQPAPEEYVAAEELLRKRGPSAETIREMRELRQAAKALMRKGCPRIDLRLPVGQLHAYVDEWSTANHGTQRQQRESGAPGGIDSEATDGNESRFAGLPRTV